MSNIAQDIKSGLKGIKGAGDAVRGSVLQAGDELLDPKGRSHPDTAAAQAKNRAIAEQGAAEAKAADSDIGARHGPGSSTTTAKSTASRGVVGSGGQAEVASADPGTGAATTPAAGTVL